MIKHENSNNFDVSGSHDPTDKYIFVKIFYKWYILYKKNNKYVIHKCILFIFYKRFHLFD